MTPKNPFLAKRSLLTAAGLGFALAGLGVSWWRDASKRDAALSQEASAALWQAQLESLQAEMVPLSQFKGSKLVINFWATWCVPCVEEMPLLDAFFQQNASKGWHVLGLAIDQPSLVKKFIAQRPVSYPVFLAGLEGTELSRLLGDVEGGLPFTLVLDASGQVAFRKMGKLYPQDLRSWLSI
jgi:hypothetical protein